MNCDTPYCLDVAISRTDCFDFYFKVHEEIKSGRNRELFRYLVNIICSIEKKKPDSASYKGPLDLPNKQQQQLIFVNSHNDSNAYVITAHPLEHKIHFHALTDKSQFTEKVMYKLDDLTNICMDHVRMLRVCK